MKKRDTEKHTVYMCVWETKGMYSEDRNAENKKTIKTNKQRNLPAQKNPNTISNEQTQPKPPQKKNNNKNKPINKI